MKGMVVGMSVAIVFALGVLQLVTLNNAPPPDPAVILQGAASSQRAYAEAIRLSDRAQVPLTPAEEAAKECEARARMAAAVHRADPAQVREACLFTWRTTGALPR